MNWQELLKDKRFLAAAAVVGVVGVVVLVRKKSTSTPGDAEEEDNTGTAVKGKFDTTATDMASWVSENNKATLDAILAAMRAGQTGGSITPPAPVPPPAYVPVPRVTSAPGTTSGTTPRVG